MRSPPAALSRLDRAVYELVRSGALNAVHRPLYSRELARLVDAGLVRLDGDRFVVISSARAGRAASKSGTAALVVRVPVELIEALDNAGAPNRSEATRRALAKGLGVKLPPRGE